jgi:hypothetical protein
MKMATPKMTPELARKVTDCLRKYASLQADNERLKEENEAIVKDQEDLKKEAEACRAVLDGIRDGVYDPEDYEEKVAELKGMDLSSIKTASPTGAVSQSVGIGTVHNKTASVDGELDPMTEYLLNMNG